jgi:hypothetical protein
MATVFTSAQDDAIDRMDRALGMLKDLKKTVKAAKKQLKTKTDLKHSDDVGYKCAEVVGSLAQASRLLITIAAA